MNKRMETGAAVCDRGVGIRKHPEWHRFGLDLCMISSAAKTNRGLMPDERKFAEKFLEALRQRSPEVPSAPLSAANYPLKYFSYALGQISYTAMKEKIWEMKEPQEVIADLIRATQNLLRIPKERDSLEKEVETLQYVALYFKDSIDDKPY